jgi:putative FmdB family regulatory protein
MPIYAYRCQDCGFEKDELQKFSDAPLTVCPSCNGNGFARQLTAPAFQLKGSGWYVTDFRDGGSKKKSESEPKAGTETPAAGSGSSTESGEASKGDAGKAEASSGSDKPASTAAPAASGGAAGSASTPPSAGA